MTNDLQKRVFEHKSGMNEGFTQKYNVFNLVYYETFQDVNEAITREKNLKKWKRDWKIRLIQGNNIKWIDLSKDWYDDILND